jgi:hypothetical protein
MRQVIGADPGLLEQRRHQAIGLAAMLHAFANRVGARVVSLHGVVDHHAALAIQPGLFGELDVRADTDGHHHQVGGEFLPAFEAHTLHPALAEDFLRDALENELQAARFKFLAQHARRGLIELALHEDIGKVHHCDLHALLHQTIRGLEAEQPAADHDRVLILAGRGQHALDIGEIAEADDPRQILARHRQQKRIRTGSQQQAIIACLGAIFGHDLAVTSIDTDDLLALVQGDAMIGIPGIVIQDDVGEFFLAAQHRRQQDAIVVDLRLGAEHGDIVFLRRELEQLLNGADAGHTIADDHQLFLHAATPNRWKVTAYLFGI